MAGDIESLPFTQERLRLIAGPIRGPADQKRREDRSTRVVETWHNLKGELRTLRKQTLGYCEATEGKNGTVTIKVSDRKGYDEIQTAIKAHSDRITHLEEAIEKLAPFDPFWFYQLEHSISNLESTESDHKRRLAGIASGVLARSTGSARTPEEILKSDERYQSILEAAEKDTAMAKAMLEKEGPKFQQIREILEAVGC